MTLAQRWHLIPWRHRILLAICLVVALAFAHFQSMSPPALEKPVPRTPVLAPKQRQVSASGSLLGPLTVQRSDNGMLISGTIGKVPTGTKIWVQIIREPGRPENPVSGLEDDHVVVGSDGNFQASIRNPNPGAFKPGTYRVLIECYFNSAWQTVDVLRSAGVELDGLGRSSATTAPKAIPESSDLKPDDPEFPKAGRHLSVIREITLEGVPADVNVIEVVKNATLLVQGKGRSSLSVGKSVEYFASLAPLVEFKPVGWSAAHGSDGKWIITLDFIDVKKPAKAQWSYDPKSQKVKYLDPQAKALSYVPAD